MCIQPIEHRAEPELQVLWLEYPVALIREDEELGVDTATLQRRVKLHTFANRHTKIMLTVNHQRRRVEVLRKLVWGPAGVKRRIIPRGAFELPLRKPQLFRSPIHT